MKAVGSAAAPLGVRWRADHAPPGARAACRRGAAARVPRRPCSALRLTPGSLAALPGSTESAQGLADAAARRSGPGALTPTQVVVDAGAPGAAGALPCTLPMERLADRLVRTRGLRRRPRLVGAVRLARTAATRASYVVGRHEFGDPPSRRLVGRLRTASCRPRVSRRTRVAVGGAAPQGVDFLARAYGAVRRCSSLVALLPDVRRCWRFAFRSLLLPLKAIVLNVLTGCRQLRSCSCVDLRLSADRGLGPDLPLRRAVRPLHGLRGVPRLAHARGLGRAVPTTQTAVATGLERTGGLITAAATRHGRVVRRLRGGQRSRPAAVRPRPRACGADRRDASSACSSSPRSWRSWDDGTGGSRGDPTGHGRCMRRRRREARARAHRGRSPASRWRSRPESPPSRRRCG